MTEGIDVSNNNRGAFDQGAAFCWIKSTEGTSFLDGWYVNYVAKCESYGIPWGAYHFAHPDMHSPEQEAVYFQSRPLGVRPMLDVESRPGVDPLSIMGPALLARWINEFCGATGSIVYLNRSYLKAMAPLLTVGLPICLATLDGSIPSVYAGRTISVVQHSIVNGIDRDTDLVGYFSTSPGGLHMDADVQAAFAAIKTDVDNTKTDVDRVSSDVTSLHQKVDALIGKVDELLAKPGSGGSSPAALHVELSGTATPTT